MAKWWRSMGNPSMFKIDDLPYYISTSTINLVSYISCAVMIFHRFCVTREFGYKYLIWWAQYFLFKCKNKILLKKGRINSQSSIIVTSTIGVKQGSWRSETLFGMCMDQFEQMVHKFYGPSWFYGNVLIMVMETHNKSPIQLFIQNIQYKVFKIVKWWWLLLGDQSNRDA